MQVEKEKIHPDNINEEFDFFTHKNEKTNRHLYGIFVISFLMIFGGAVISKSATNYKSENVIAQNNNKPITLKDKFALYGIKDELEASYVNLEFNGKINREAIDSLKINNVIKKSIRDLNSDISKKPIEFKMSVIEIESNLNKIKLETDEIKRKNYTEYTSNLGKLKKLINNTNENIKFILSTNE